MSLTSEDLEQIRAIVREEIERAAAARRGPRRPDASPSPEPPPIDEATTQRARELVRDRRLGRGKGRAR